MPRHIINPRLLQQQKQQFARLKQSTSTTAAATTTTTTTNTSATTTNSSSNTDHQLLSAWTGSNENENDEKERYSTEEDEEQRRKREKKLAALSMFLITKKSTSNKVQKDRSKQDVSSQFMKLLHSKKNWVVFDLETTGFSPTTDQILEIGAKRTSEEEELMMESSTTKENEKKQNFFINQCKLGEGKTIHPCAAKVNGFTLANIASRKDDMSFVTPSEAILNFASFAFQIPISSAPLLLVPSSSGENENNEEAIAKRKSEDTVLIAHNAAFDTNFLLHQICRDREALNRKKKDLMMSSPNNNINIDSQQKMLALQQRVIDRKLLLLNLLFDHVCSSSSDGAGEERIVCTKRLFSTLFPDAISSTLEACYKFMTGEDMKRNERTRECSSVSSSSSLSSVVDGNIRSKSTSPATASLTSPPNSSTMLLSSGTRRERSDEDGTENSVMTTTTISRRQPTKIEAQNSIHHNAADDVNATVEVLRRLVKYVDDLQRT